MSELRGWMIVSWIALPTVMYGGYALLRLTTQTNAATPFRLTWFRAGHAHAGVLLLMSLLYYTFMDKTSLSTAAKNAGCATLAVGILAQSGGFFIHMIKGQANRPSIGTTVTAIGALLLTCAIAFLVYGLFTAH
jgi:hypothetical protein